MSWKFDDRIVNGWPVTGLFDDDHLILGATGFTAPEGSYKRQIEAVPEMLELFKMFDKFKNHDVGLWVIRRKADTLIAKIEGGEK